MGLRGRDGESGNSGIGKATAVDLAQRGARVILACRDKERGESAVHDVRQESGNSEVILMILDLASLNSCCARIVIVASIFISLGISTSHHPQAGERVVEVLKSYCNSKLANILHVRELAKWLEGINITCYVVHPGFVQTEIGRSYPRFALWVIRVIKPFLRDWKTGAQTIIYCATEEGIERLSGQYFVDCQLKVPWPQARDDLVAENLWEFSEMLLGLTTSDRKGQRWSLG
ncbi:hypothetical protein E2320_018043 [Naja naja]|nr:hypothetical protein E2320_018043 [Naja naja]